MLSSRNKKYFGKIKIASVAFLFLFFFNLFLVQPARAQWVVTNPTLDAEAIERQIREAIDSSYKNIGRAAGRALTKTLRNFLNKFAQDTATYLASGDYSGGPMWISDAGNYWQDAADSASGDFIGTFGDEWALTKKYGINLCSPGPPELTLAIKLSMVNVQNPQPRCKFSEIAKAYERMAEPEYWDKIAVGFQPGQNGLSMSRAALEASKIVAAKGEAQAKLAADFAGKILPKEDPITHQAVTPQKGVESALPDPQAAAAAKAAEAESAKNDLNEGNIINVLQDAGMMFLDTLSNKLTETLLKKGMYSLGALIRYIKGSGGGGEGETVALFDSQFVVSRLVAQASFANFTKPAFSQIEDYRSQYLAEISNSCDSNPTPYCGALDESFKEIFNLAQNGESLTVSEALQKQLLHGDWLLLGPDASCKTQAYCYANLVKLRVLRILPIGWEMAAKVNSAPNVTPITLQQVIDKFYDSTPGNLYYHLIDPNWLIVAPKARCAAQAYSSLFFTPPTDGAPGQRAQYCADIQNCVGEDSKTGICNSWGYCLREKNLWRLGGDSCDAQFNTCAIYTDSQGRQANYLANTLNKGICTADNVGCRGYATTSTVGASGLQWNASALKIYFDQDVQQCDASNEGCSKFFRTAPEVFNQPLNLKKAPSYYNCYGESLVPIGVPTVTTLSSSTLAWAVNKTDLFKIFNAQTAEQKQACAKFAGVCSKEEKGCELYTPDNGNPAVPGILTTADQCPNECVGYETYLEQPLTQFSASTTNYFIPATAKSCQSEYVGCEEFINLEAQSSGGEQKEYYSQLKTCSKDEAEGETYYTWEGSDTTGYQLKTYTLKKNAGDSSPAYNTADTILLDGFNNQCSSAVYANRVSLGSVFNPDCREFYNRAGAKFYKLYSKTITVDPAECKTLRKTLSDKSSCDATGGLWDDAQKFCTYLAMTKEAKSCVAEAVGCRAYRGNAGNNFQTIYSENFESGTVGALTAPTIGWSGKFSSEATAVGGKSIKITGSSSQVFSSEKNKTFLVSFWAKGEDSNLTMEFYPSNSSGNPQGASSVPPQTLTITNNWAAYTFGPVTTDWDPAVSSSTLKFSVTAGKSFYLDNVIVKMMTDNIYVIKDSWVTPASCDNVVGDPLGQSAGGNFVNPFRLVPQAQLGCSNYKNRQGAAVAAKSFTNICREEAVGCEELVDTFNTETASSTIVNALCELNVVSESNQAVGCKDKSGTARCDVFPNQKGCHFNFLGTTAELIALTDTSLTTFETTDVEGKGYSVSFKLDAQQSILIPKALGQAPLGDRTVYLVNDSRFQCSNDNLGCRALGSITYDSKGFATSTITAYLKDNPQDYDKTLCEKDAEGCDKYAKTNGGADYFKDPSVFGNKLCEWKNTVDESHPYGGWVVKNTTSSCYAALNYNILKNKDAGYSGAVGLCPAEQNGCSEFVDPAEGQAYYLLNNGRVDKNTCQGQASLQKGCVLFNETGKGDILWNASSTYKLSEKQNYIKVGPVDCGNNGEKCGGIQDKNDSNIVLKVIRDRVCGEWLACASTMTVVKNGQPAEVCTELRVCDKAQSSNIGSDELLGKCAHWVEDADLWPYKGYRLDSGTYAATLNAGKFSAKDYSGYSLPEDYQIFDLEIGTVNGLTGLVGKSNTSDSGIFKNSQPLTESCRGFASVDAPYKKDNQDLYCSFAKASYGGGDKTPIDKYSPANELLDNSGVCDGGFNEKGESKRGERCFSVNDCADDRIQVTNQSGFAGSAAVLDGNCLTNKTVTRQFGWQGYCLFKDSVTKSCVQWFPLTTPSKSIDVYALNQEAGYYPPEGSGKYWCVQAKGNFNRASSVGSSINPAQDYAIKNGKVAVDQTDFGYFVSQLDFLPENQTAFKYPGGARNADQACVNFCKKPEATNYCSTNCEQKMLACQLDCTKKNFLDFVETAEFKNQEYTAAGGQWDDQFGDLLWTNFAFTPSYSLNVNDIAAVEFHPTGAGGDDDDDWPRPDSLGGSCLNHYTPEGCATFSDPAGAFNNSFWLLPQKSFFQDMRLWHYEGWSDFAHLDQTLTKSFSSPLKTVTINSEKFQAMDLIWAEVGSLSAPFFNAQFNFGNFNRIECKNYIGNSNALALRLLFDSSGQLKEIQTKTCDGTDGAGSVRGNLSFHLKSLMYPLLIQQPVGDAENKSSKFLFWAYDEADHNVGASEPNAFNEQQINALPQLNLSEVAAIYLKNVRSLEGDGDWLAIGSIIPIFPDQKLEGVSAPTALTCNSGQQGCEGNYWSGPLRKTDDGLVLDAIWAQNTDITKNYIKSSNFDLFTSDLCDKFQKNNDAKGQSWLNNALGIRLIFDNTTGWLKNLQTKVCDASDGGMHINADVVAYLKEVCTDIRQYVKNDTTTKNEPFGFLAKARTDRVWDASSYKLGGDLRKNTAAIPLDLSYNQLNTPFGSFGRTEAPLSLDKSLDDLLKGIKSNFDKIKIVSQAGLWPISQSPNSATPFNISPEDATGGTVGRICVGGENDGGPCGSAADCPSREHTNTRDNKAVTELGSCIGSVLDGGSAIPSSGDSGRAYERGSEIFVQGFNSWKWKPDAFKYTANTDQSAPYDDSKGIPFTENLDASVNPIPPRLYALSKTGPSSYTWGSSDSMSINGVDGKDISNTLKGVGSFTANLNFFAVADNNQMPIKRISIDWGDRGEIYETNGWYKNKKPICASEDNKVCGIKSGTTVSYPNRPCNSNSDCNSLESETCFTPSDGRIRFGNSASACEQGFYTFRHVYLCAGQGTLAACVDNPAINAPCWNGSSCVYQPRVQILDNWGWCNGTCNSYGVAGGCWDDPILSEKVRKCSVENASIPHWTAFGGTIEVKP